MVEKPENKGGSNSQNKNRDGAKRSEFQDNSKANRPRTEQKVTSNLKPPTRPNKK